MTQPTLTLRHLCFSGPNKEPATVNFGQGLNVIYGASETGKSFLLEALDFMLGSGKELRDIPERVGFDRVFLGIEEQRSNDSFTLERSTSGGDFRCYQGLHFDVPAEEEPLVLRAKHNPKREDNLSTYLLSKIGLAGKRIRKNARGDTNSLTFRYLSHLCLIAEDSIQKQGSPIETGQHTSRTAEFSAFKLLVTGVDDSAVQPVEKKDTERLSRTAKIEVIDELIADYRDRVTSLVGDEDDKSELETQISELDEKVQAERDLLNQSEQSYQEALGQRNQARRKLEDANERRSEIDELLARFGLLDRHYESDLARLDGIREAGALASALDKKTCPLCGAPPESQHSQENCDGDIDSVVTAADAEISKIRKLQTELHDTVKELNREASEFDDLTPKIAEQLKQSVENLGNLNPPLSEKRKDYADLMETKSVLQSAYNMLSSISELEERRLKTGGSLVESEPQETPATDVSFSTLDDFSKLYEQILKAWNFPEAERVFFDKKSRDFVIAGKPRGARGKGLRALTHAAFTVGLLEFTRLNELPYPGFVVLDTPLLAYREPEGDDDDLTGTDVQDRLYEYLLERTDRQVIVLENVDPPSDVKDRPQSVFFSKNPHSGRYGLFPI
jgi:uncharacterized coiled-coil DUF342 family protein